MVSFQCNLKFTTQTGFRRHKRNEHGIDDDDDDDANGNADNDEPENDETEADATDTDDPASTLGEI